MSEGVLKVAFDFGSGCTKVGFARVHDGNRIEMIYEEERETLLGQSMKESANGTVSQAAIEGLHEVVRYFVRHVFECAPRNRDGSKPAALPVTAVATAVYREAANAAAILEGIRREFGFSVIVLSQREEGDLGFDTAAVLLSSAGKPMAGKPLIVWDCGGSSFQITAGVVGQPNDSRQVLEGPWGSSKATFCMVSTVQGKPFVARVPGGIPSCNPATPDNLNRTIAIIEEDVRKHVKLPTSWAACSCVGLGGPLSAFRMASMCSNRLEGITYDVLYAAVVQNVCNKTDEELAAAGYLQKEMVVAKLALILGVMRALNITDFQYIFANGGVATLVTRTCSPLCWLKCPGKL